jgi:MFS family permease
MSITAGRTGAVEARVLPEPDIEARTVLTVALGEVLVQLGLSPVTAVVPSLAAAVGAGPAEGPWILTVFILALAGSLLVSGRLGDLLGHRRVFAAGAAVYGVASVAAAFAPAFGGVLLARVAQGLGAAMVSGNNLAILANAVSSERRARAIALVATASSLSAVVGSAAATAAVAAGLWPLVFLGPAPLALVAAVRARRLPATSRQAGRVPVDWAGAGLLLLTMTLFAVALNRPYDAAAEAAWPLLRWLPALPLVSVALFVLVERRAAVPLLDWRPLGERVFAAAIGVNGVLHMTMMAAMFLGPLLVVQGFGRTAVAGGLVMVVVQASSTLTAFAAGWLYDRTRSPALRPGAALLLGAGFVGFGFAAQAGTYPGLLAAGTVSGLGLGVLLSVNNTVIMGALPADQRGVASGMLETTRHFAHAFGVTIPTAILGLVAASAAGGLDGAAIRAGVFWSCLGMAGVTAIGVLLALVRPQERPAREGRA